MTQHTTLYRLFDSELRLLYVGIAGNPGRRFEQHATDKPWWSEVAHVRTRHYDTRQLATEAERQAIQDENPRYNLAHSKKPRAVPAADREFELICTGCGRPGADYLEVDSGKALHNHYESERLDRELEQKTAARGLPGMLIEGADLFRRPSRIPWQAWHRTCDPRPEADTYWFDANRISTWEHVANWTAHLMGKIWFHETDWQQLLWDLSGHNPRLLRRAS